VLAEEQEVLFLLLLQGRKILNALVSFAVELAGHMKSAFLALGAIATTTGHALFDTVHQLLISQQQPKQNLVLLHQHSTLSGFLLNGTRNQIHIVTIWLKLL